MFKTAGRIAKRMGNSADPNQTAPLAYNVCLGKFFFQIQDISQSSTQGAIFNQKIDRYYFFHKTMCSGTLL